MYLKNNQKIIDKMISSEHYRFKIQTLVTSLLFGLIGMIMFIVNIKTHTVNLIYITGSMCFIGFSMAAYIYITKSITIPRILNSIVFFFSMISFIYNGGIDGFSPYWLLLLPYLSFFFYEFKIAASVSFFTFLIVIFMLWTPFRYSLQYNYYDSFYMRFPILYAACLITAIATEYIKNHTFLELKKTVSELDRLSRYDDLTGLENRRACEMHINDLWHIFRHKENCITILIVDIDNFKNYNDYYGHLAGDKVLISVANILKETINEFNGYISRWGGEEFICLLPFTNSSNGKIIADKLVKSVSNAKIPHIKTPLKEKIITVSIGGASTNISEDTDPVEIINAADKSMYEAKNSGKNKSGNFNIFSKIKDNQAV